MGGTKIKKTKNQHGLFSWFKLFHRKKNVVDMQVENKKKARSISNNNNKSTKSNPTLQLITEKQQTNGVTRSSSTGIISQISSSNETATTYQETDDHLNTNTNTNKNKNKDNKSNNKKNDKMKSKSESNLFSSTISTNEHDDQLLLPSDPSITINDKNKSNIDHNHHDQQPSMVEKNISETKSKTNNSIEIHWKHGGNQVYLTGTFDQWQKTIRMEKQNGEFLGTIPSSFSSGKPIYYKFIVDDVWVYDVEKPTEKDPNGNINNVVYT
ncbi:unnamed protein product [Cunninghamella blakesleeana]